MMKELVDEILCANSLIYRIMIYGREHYGDNWNKTLMSTKDLTWAVFWFEDFQEYGKKYLEFAKDESFWYNLEKNLRYKEVESQGYCVRMKKYLKQYLRHIWQVDYQILMKSAFITDLLDDEYISQKEADDFCKFFVNVHNKEVKDVKRACKIILEIINPKVEAEIQTPTVDFLFANIDLEKKNKFMSFCAMKTHGKVKLDDSNVVLLLKMVVEDNIKERLKKNKFKLKGLWLELKQLNVISSGADCNNLNQANRSNKPVKPEIQNAWNDYLKK